MKRTLADFEELTAAEAQVRDEIGHGRFITIGDGTLPPEGAGGDRTIRADFVRYLMLGGCAALPLPVPETGIRIAGARIDGVLDLEGCRCPRDLALVACRIDAPPVLRSARLDGVFLEGSRLPGLEADRLETRGGVFLRNLVATGAVRLLGATLGGDLDCTGARLTAGTDGKALNADGLKTRGGVFLDDIGARGDAACRGEAGRRHVL